MQRYFAIYKPYLVLSQFTSTEGKKTLADYFDLPADVYPVGRLDHDSEGLLLLTNDAQVNQRLLNPKHKHEREYWVQVDGLVTTDAVRQLQNGVVINIDGKPYKTAKAKVEIFPASPDVSERVPPIRFRKSIPTSWLKIVLTEGKNRQVRRMTAHVGFPTLRLIRYRIEQLTLNGMQPGDLIPMNKAVFYALLKL
ncbi:pseudouridine synthase [Segetibacter sp. 3557_3]|uniref:pseudouridine synthase n=1 Tax=Segetibacter sp. 3557_3 TaxID=2547429 RepID=UPI001058FFD2|nr:pseudouridine synthase [Segetibacter sp. 3557_3]TDH18346.1 pseudouridine synthase [Segetibacter sp. 3557_3]